MLMFGIVVGYDGWIVCSDDVGMYWCEVYIDYDYFDLLLLIWGIVDGLLFVVGSFG